MSLWLEQLPLKHVPNIGTLNKRLDPFPNWAGFMIWYGWWLRSTTLDSKRLLAVLVVPDRSCCSALCSFGALIASTQIIYAGITWNEFKDLPEGMEIYLKDGDKNLIAKIGNLENIYGQESRRVYPTNRAKYKDSSLIITENNLSYKQISLLPHTNNRDLPAIIDLYKRTVNRFHDSWASSMVTECRVVTNKAQWSRDVEDIMLFSYDNGKEYACKLGSLLFTKDGNDYCPPKVSIITPKALNKSKTKVSVTVSDGADALRHSISNVNKSVNNLFLLSHDEYDNSCCNDLSQLSQYRCEADIPFPEEYYNKIPSGIDSLLFALPVSEGM